MMMSRNSFLIFQIKASMKFALYFQTKLKSERFKMEILKNVLINLRKSKEAKPMTMTTKFHPFKNMIKMTKMTLIIS